MTCLKPIHAASTLVFFTLLFATATLAHQHPPEEHTTLERETLLESFGWDVDTAEIRTEKSPTVFMCCSVWGAISPCRWEQTAS